MGFFSISVSAVPVFTYALPLVQFCLNSKNKQNTLGIQFKNGAEKGKKKFIL
jgi:hypothetical protein